MKRMLVALLMAMISAGLVFALPATASAQATVGISVGYAPPPLPWYPQPVCPGAGYLWTPGYWAWGAEGYFWVPGSWAFAPATGLLWTPGYWAWDDGLYWWHPGYWAQDVGFYGGIDYGYGYYGAGYLGGYWRDGDFYYNREIDDLDDGGGYHVYDGPAQPQAASNHLSYNGGYGGVAMRPTAAQEKYAREQHWKATSVQRDQERLASADPQQRYALNRGMPRIVATTRAGEFPAVDRMPRQAQLGGYRVSGRVQTLEPAYDSAVTRVRDPIPQPAGRPGLISDSGGRMWLPKPPVSRSAGEHERVYRPPVTLRTDGWDSRSNHRFTAPEDHSAPVRHDSWNRPRFQPMHVTRSSGAHSKGGHFKPPR